VQTGNLIFLAGQIGTGAQGTVVPPGEIETETCQALLNIQDVLEASASSMDPSSSQRGVYLRCGGLRDTMWRIPERVRRDRTSRP
jgi:hypothetical protein